jgi:DHA1 family inner membrane transport protein
VAGVNAGTVNPDDGEARLAMPWALIVASCLAMFATTSSGTTRAPFLIDMARDFDVAVPMIASLFGLTSIAWGVASFATGMVSDRFGRRVFLVGGPLAQSLAMYGFATSGSFVALAMWAAASGACGGIYTGVSLAEVAGRVADRQRGRALGWVMSGQSLTLLVGVPAAAWIGASVGWRGAALCVGVLALVSALAMFATTRPQPNPAGDGVAVTTVRPSLRTALSPLVIRLLGSVIAERVCFGLAAVYYATFLISTYGLSLDVLALPLFVFALGNILGTILGGQLGDLLPNRLLTFAVTLAISGFVALALFGWHPNLATSVALGFFYVFFNALCRPALMAALAQVPADVRGTVMGLNSTCASIGWLSAATLGGWMLGTVGFGGFGPLTAVLALSGAALALIGPRLRSRIG